MRVAITHIMLMPTVSDYMTREPYSVVSTDSLARARDLMRRHHVRHLPVVDRDQLVGVISDRDVEVVGVVPGVDLAFIEVSRVMEPALHVWAETPIDEVSSLMADRKCDCVVVRGGHGVEGVFTAVDALRALANIAARATA